MVKKACLILLLTTAVTFQCCNKEKIDTKTIESSVFRIVPPEQSNVVFNTYTNKTSPMEQLGVSLGHLNNDNLIDICFFSRKEIRIYLNQGELKFKDITKQLNIDFDSIESNGKVSLIDVTGDGLAEIFITQTNKQKFQDVSSNQDKFFINNGDLSFFQDSNILSLITPGANTDGVFLDYDNDGDLDYCVGNRPYTSKNQIELSKIFSFNFFANQKNDTYKPIQFYENIDNKFFPRTHLYSSSNSYPNALRNFDYNNDGFVDLFVANDFLGHDFLLNNDPTYGFVNVDSTIFSINSLASMGVDIADINNDGFQDLFVAEMLPVTNERQKSNLLPFSYEFYDKFQDFSITKQYQRNTFYLNKDGQHLDDISLLTQTYASEWSWSPLFGDFDCDGNKDLFISNGFKFDWTNVDFLKSTYDKAFVEIIKGTNLEYNQNQFNEDLMISHTPTNFVYRNTGDFQFTLANKNWGLNDAFSTFGSATADLDNDGDLDLICNNLDTTAFIYENLTNEKNENFKYLKVDFVGQAYNYYGIGAKVFLYYKNQMQSFENTYFRGFLSNSAPQAHFGLPEHIQTVDSIIVVWPGGAFETVKNQSSNQTLTLKQKNASGNYYQEFQKTPLPFFSKLTIPNIHFEHEESRFVDFKRDKLIHRKISREGPSIAVGDVDNNGKDDFYIGGASGQHGVLYLQFKNGFVASSQQDMYLFPESEELSTHFLDVENDGDLDLYIASGSNEFSANSPAQLDRLFLNDGKGYFTYSPNSLPNISTSTNAVSSADFDKDGDLDIFVGGRVQPENYPLNPYNYLLENNEGGYTNVTEIKAKELVSTGMVTSSVWDDFDQDGDRDLILVGEWMSFTIFENKEGVLNKKNLGAIGQNTKGWWNVVKAKDMDNDGDTDFLLGNHGLNSFFKASETEPLTLLTNDFDSNNSLDPVLFRYIDGINAPFMNRDIFCQKMPYYNNLYYSFNEYAKANLENMFTPELKSEASMLQANNMNSVWIENLSELDSFVIHTLPIEAQFAPIYDFEFCDFNKDNIPDLICVGNSFSNHYEHGDINALGVGLFKNENKKFVFEKNSGFNVYTDAKCIVPINFDQKELFIIGSNNSKLKIYMSN